MKENVIIGKLIPAGTGMKRYRNIKLDSEMPTVEMVDINGEEIYNPDELIPTIQIGE